jgi:hypothetical protein
LAAPAGFDPAKPTSSSGVSTPRKELVSVVCYALAMAFVQPLVSGLFYALVAILWLVPDRRNENALRAEAVETPR